ncbi:MAG: RNA-directed DNA polymerase [Patescibacteria group bacterium]|nr:RNA-directed DNA polymerase [Patescibacteria group bacterium]
MPANVVELAALLGVEPKPLAEMVADPLRHYHPVFIPKKTTGKRRIDVPTPALKTAQRALLKYLSAKHSQRACVYGFDSGHSIIENARYHASGSYLLNVDIADFFPSVHWSRVRRILSRHFREAALAAVLNLTTLHRSLPQGAATSPLMANEAVANLDTRLMGLARSEGLRYTRYFDDISLSSDSNVSRYEELVATIIRQEGYRLNAKTTLYAPGEVRLITGIEIWPDCSLHVPDESGLLRVIQDISARGLVALDDERVFKSRSSLAGKIAHVKAVNPPLGQAMQEAFCKIAWPD